MWFVFRKWRNEQVSDTNDRDWNDENLIHALDSSLSRDFIVVLSGNLNEGATRIRYQKVGRWP